MAKTLRQSFGKALEVPEDSKSTDILTQMMIKENKESVNSVLPTEALTVESAANQHVTPPCRLNTVVDHACGMLKLHD